MTACGHVFHWQSMDGRWTFGERADGVGEVCDRPRDAR